MQKFAFIGLGNMGKPMMLNLAKSKYQIKIFDLSKKVLNSVNEKKILKCDSALDCVNDADIVFTMLPSGKNLIDLFLNKKIPLFNFIKKNAFIIDSSTIDVHTVKKLNQESKKYSLKFIDAPVSGGVAGAKTGKLAFMVGGTPTQFRIIKPILSLMGEKIFHAGKVGSGQIAKACNNHLLAIQMAGTSEAINLGKKSGLNPKILSEIMTQSSGNNWALQVYNPYPNVMKNVPSSNKYKGGFKVKLMMKDLGLSQNLSKSSKSRIPIGNMVRKLYSEHTLDGNKELDFSSILKWYQKF